MEDPLDYIDFAEVILHGDPSNWKPRGEKDGSGVPADSSSAPAGTLKNYELYEDEFGDEVEVHYFRHPDGSVSNVKVRPR